MSECVDVRPGLWLVHCVDEKLGGCQGGALSPGPGVFICHDHAKARGLLDEEESSNDGSGSPAPVTEPPIEQPAEDSNPPVGVP
jgi:hypothetical protein